MCWAIKLVGLAVHIRVCVCVCVGLFKTCKDVLQFPCNPVVPRAPVATRPPPTSLDCLKDYSIAAAPSVST